MEKRAPNSGERTAAVKLGGLLDKAKYRDRVEIRGTAVTPPGRLRTRALIQNRAMKENGVHATVEPWRRTIRKHTDDPTLKVGVMVDISGSMGSAMQPMASTAWVLSEAVRRIQGRAAMVYYGESVFATLKPGQHLTDVTVYSAPDGTEKFNEAASALNGAMNLTGGSGARLMVVVSDGIYTDKETPKAREWVKRMTENGVGVVWLTEGDSHGYYGTGAKHICKGTSAELVVVDGLDVTKATDLIGQAAIRALSRVNQP
jgi:Mg-chelatase subunit ChlD